VTPNQEQRNIRHVTKRLYMDTIEWVYLYNKTVDDAVVAATATRIVETAAI
jgi:hypothetical protein